MHGEPFSFIMFESGHKGKISFFPHSSSAKLPAHFPHKNTRSATHRINPLLTSHKESLHKHLPQGEIFCKHGLRSNLPLKLSFGDNKKFISPF